MVFFTCSHCGESLKKNKVEKHYHAVCRGNPVALTCVDCCKDFNEETFTTHTKCVTEEERYAAKGFVPKPSANKGERKQQRWQDIIRTVKNTRQDLSQGEQQILALLVNQENVPRKRNKFQNYLKTNLHGRYKEEVANCVFDILEEQSKLEEAKEKTDDDNDKSQQNGETKVEEKENISVCEKEEEKQLSKKERKELKKKAKYEAQLKQIENENEAVEENTEEVEVPKKNKKSKKNKETEEEETVITNGIDGKKGKKKNKSESLENGDNDETQEQQKSKKKRKKETAVEEEDGPAEKKSKEIEPEEEQTEGTEAIQKQKFNWEKVIVSLLETKDDKELSLKRLKKKVLAELEACGETNAEKNIIKFNKKINKISGIVILKDKVRLKSISV